MDRRVVTKFDYDGYEDEAFDEVAGGGPAAIIVAIVLILFVAIAGWFLGRDPLPIYFPDASNFLEGL